MDNFKPLDQTRSGEVKRQWGVIAPLVFQIGFRASSLTLFLFPGMAVAGLSGS